MTDEAFSSGPQESVAGTLVGVVADPSEDVVVRGRAETVARELGLALLENDGEPRRHADSNQVSSDHVKMILAVTSERIEIRVIAGEEGLRGGHAVAVNLMVIDVSSPFGRSLQQPIAKAIGRKRYADPAPRILDVTAGMGEDTWVMAAFGCEVTAVERNPVIAMMLRDGLERAGRIKPEISARIKLIQDDGIAVLRALLNGPVEERPDLIYVDPMFPTGRKTREQKTMRVVRCLVGDDGDAKELLELARKVAKRVVVKRPLHAPGIEGTGEPSVVFKGKSLRFDVFVAGMNGAPELA